jgi:hypothetical protein
MSIISAIQEAEAVGSQSEKREEEGRKGGRGRGKAAVQLSSEVLA